MQSPAKYPGTSQAPGAGRGRGGLRRGVGLAAALGLGACQSALGTSPPVAVSPPAAAPAAAAAAAPTAAAPAPVESEAVLSNRRRHHAFAEQFLLLEKNQVNEFWHCLLGPDGNGYQFENAEALKTALMAQLAPDAKTFIETARTDCVGKAFQAAEAAKKLVPPAEYAQTLTRYGQTCTALAGGLNEWAVAAPRYIDLQAGQQRLLASGEKWRSTSPAGVIAPQAWQYHQFLHCALPELDKLAGAPALAELLAQSCPASPDKGRDGDAALLSRLRDSCLTAKESAVKNPAAFRHTFTRFAPDHARLAQGWDGCFRRLDAEVLSRDLTSFGRAWADWLAASTKMFELIKKAFCDGGEPKFCGSAKDRPPG